MGGVGSRGFGVFSGRNGSAVTSVSGTADRITVTGTTTATIDIASTYVGQTSITTLGTIGTGTWQGTAIADSYIASAATWNAKVGGSGTTNTLSKFTASGTIGDSSITDDGTTVTATSGSLVISGVSGRDPLTVNTDATNNMFSVPESGVIMYRGVDFLDADIVLNNYRIGESAMDVQSVTGSDNYTYGFDCGTAITSGSRNVLIGSLTGDAITTGDDNMLFGYNSGSQIVDGVRNVAIGGNTLLALVNGDNNTAVGESAMDVLTGSNCSGIGRNAGGDWTGSNQCTTVGANSGGSGIQTGSVYIGYENGSGTTYDYVSSIGYSTRPSSDNQALIASYSSTFAPTHLLLGLDESDIVGKGAFDFNIRIGHTKGTDTTGGNLSIGSQQSTGSGVAGNIILQTASTGTTGTSVNALVDRLTVLGGSGYVGIGVTPTAEWLGIKAGTTSEAQINFANSTAPSSPNQGDLWSTGTTFNFYDGTSTIDLLDFDKWNVVTETTTSRSAANQEYILVNNTTCTVTLPAASANAAIRVKIIVASPTAVTVKTESASNSEIDGVDRDTTGLDINNQWDVLTFTSDGTDWFIS